MYHCGNYPKVPVGTLCGSAHRIKADHVMEIVAKTIKEVIRYKFNVNFIVKMGVFLYN